MSDGLRALLEQEQKKLDLLKRVSQIDDKYRKEIENAITESGLDRTLLPFSLDGAGLIGAVLRGASSPSLSIPEAARKYLQEHPNKAASTPEIASALLAQGIKTGSKNFTATVYTILQQTPKWFKRKGQLWALVGEGR
jgi:hypothetical protein